MFAPFRNPVEAYSRVATETSIAAASPHHLVDMLFEGAERFIRQADEAIVRADAAARGEAITRAIRIVDEGLNAALDLSAGELAHTLRALYLSVSMQLLDASRHNDRVRLATARDILRELHAGWRAIAPGAVAEPEMV